MTPKVEAPKSNTNVNLKVTESKDGKEVYSSASATPTPAASVAREPASPPEEEEDDLSVPVAVGTTCKRKGCGKSFVSDEVSRSGDGEEAVCVYHPLPV